MSIKTFIKEITGDKVQQKPTNDAPFMCSVAFNSMDWNL
jgi:hypothetical protein